MKRSTLLSSFTALACLAATTLTSAADLAPNNLQGISGVAFHFRTPDTKAFADMASIGIGIARTDMQWVSVEKVQGQYDFSVFDKLADAMISQGVRPMFILDYSNPLYEPVQPGATALDAPIKPPPRHSSSVAAFNNFASAAALHFKGKNVIWEIWNEPNYTQFWPTGANAQEYGDLAVSTCWAIRNVDRDATIIGPAASAKDLNFIEAVLARGVLDCLDGVSVHPYQSANQPPENAQSNYDQIKALIQKYASPERAAHISIVNSEWGYSAAIGSGVGLDQQADYIVRQKLLDMSNQLGASIWYEWNNDSVNPFDWESNFGITDSNGNPKMTFTSMRDLAKELQGALLVGALGQLASGDYGLLFRSAAGDDFVVTWSTSATHTLVTTPSLLMRTTKLIAQRNGNALALSTRAQLSLLPVTLPFSSSPTKTVLPH
ncbi:MAG: hypothetical protein E6Q76_05310 [Rhizobium sp.]|nr:MAG: hypothetical protein E6Q76_05310 [Rhizobium sp.]